MARQKKSFFNVLGKGLLGDLLVLCLAIALFSLFAMSSFTKAYIIAFAVLMLLLCAAIVVIKAKRKNCTPG